MRDEKATIIILSNEANNYDVWKITEDILASAEKCGVLSKAEMIKFRGLM